MNSSMERLSDLQKSNQDEESYAILMKNLCKEIWPFLAVVGSVDPGFRIGGECNIDGGKKGIITEKSDDTHVKIQEVFDDGADKMEEM